MPGPSRKARKLFKKDYGNKVTRAVTSGDPADEDFKIMMLTQDRFQEVEEYEHIERLREMRAKGLPLYGNSGKSSVDRARRGDLSPGTRGDSLERIVESKYDCDQARGDGEESDYNDRTESSDDGAGTDAGRLRSRQKGRQIGIELANNVGKKPQYTPKLSPKKNAEPTRLNSGHTKNASMLNMADQ